MSELKSYLVYVDVANHTSTTIEKRARYTPEPNEVLVAEILTTPSIALKASSTIVTEYLKEHG